MNCTGAVHPLGLLVIAGVSIPEKKNLDYYMAKAKLANRLAALNHRKICLSENVNQRTTKEQKLLLLKRIVQLTLKTPERTKTKNLSHRHGKESAP